MTADGASRPLPRIPAIVSFLNPQRALSVGGGNWSSCPTPAVRNPFRDRLSWVEGVEKRICRGRRAALRSQIVAGVCELIQALGPGSPEAAVRHR
jgi:hypothetical protein